MKESRSISYIFANRATNTHLPSFAASTPPPPRLRPRWKRDPMHHRACPLHCLFVWTEIVSANSVMAFKRKLTENWVAIFTSPISYPQTNKQTNWLMISVLNCMLFDRHHIFRLSKISIDSSHSFVYSQWILSINKNANKITCSNKITGAVRPQNWTHWVVLTSHFHGRHWTCDPKNTTTRWTKRSNNDIFKWENNQLAPLEYETTQIGVTIPFPLQSKHETIKHPATLNLVFRPALAHILQIRSIA